jgi:hypothetical protein
MLRVDVLKKKLTVRNLKAVAFESKVPYERVRSFMKDSNTLRYTDAQKISDFLESEND